MSFKDKVVLVTGGSHGGIGAQIAVDFAREGAKVAITGRDVDRLKLTEEECIKVNNDCQVLILMADFIEFDKLHDIVEKTINKFEKLDVLVNNAGLLLLGDITLSNYESQMNVNVRAPLFLCKYAIPYLEKTKGCIVNISSIGSSANLGAIVYGMSKAAIDFMTSALAGDCASKAVRVNSVSPGVVLTNMNRHVQKETEDLFGPKQPLCGILKPEDISRTVLFLSSDGAANITGVDVPVDGGFLVAQKKK